MIQKKPLILFADDEPNICRIAKILLDPNLYEVITAENGIDAYEKIIKHKPNLIFSDVLMPKCDGFELCQKIKENEQISDIPFIFLTALEEKQFKLRFETVQANDYLIKPFNTEDLIGKINLWIKDKPIIHSEDHTISIEENNNSDPIILFGNKEIDDSLGDYNIKKESLIFLEEKDRDFQNQLSFDFCVEGIKNEEHVIFVHLNRILNNGHAFFNLAEQDNELLHLIDASNWTSISSEPWRSLNFIFDEIHDLCSKFPIQRIVINQFSVGYPFWEVQSVLSFINQLQSLPNHQNQIILYTTNYHESIDEYNFNINQVADINISSENIISSSNIDKNSPINTSLKN